MGVLLDAYPLFEPPTVVGPLTPVGEERHPEEELSDMLSSRYISAPGIQRPEASLKYVPCLMQQCAGACKVRADVNERVVTQ